jgi:hypothetical protein
VLPLAKHRLRVDGLGQLGFHSCACTPDTYILVSAGVQTLLDEGFRSELDVEEVCRAFLDLAKAWSRRLIELMYSDTGGQALAWDLDRSVRTLTSTQTLLRKLHHHC